MLNSSLNQPTRVKVSKSPKQSPNINAIPANFLEIGSKVDISDTTEFLISDVNSIKEMPTTSDYDSPGKEISIETVKNDQESDYIPIKIDAVSNKKEIDSCLLGLFFEGFHHYSLVEERCFYHFVNALNPSYELPNMKTISKVMVPDLYDTTIARVKECLSEASAVTVTVECWTSAKDEKLMGVTGHYINTNFEINSAFLGCELIQDSHLSQNLATELERVITEWGLQDKILITITDNSENNKKAIEEVLKWEHFACYVNSLNLILSDALKPVMGLLVKVKSIVAYYKRNSNSSAKLMHIQRNSGNEANKRIFDLKTRWNSAYCMLQQFKELEGAIRKILLPSDKELNMLSVQECNVVTDLVKVLRPLESLNKIMSGEGYLTASLSIIVTKGLQDVYSRFIEQDMSCEAKEVALLLLHGICDRFSDIESSESLLLSTFLDPRFKNVGFSSVVIAEKAKNMVIDLISNDLQQNSFNQSSELGNEYHDEIEEEISVWSTFEKSIASYSSVTSAHSKASAEVQRYLEEGLLQRNKDPMRWWQEHRYNFPYLSEIAKSKFICVASSVPCERFFSKSGVILNDRRNWLSAQKLKKIMFLNMNTKLN